MASCIYGKRHFAISEKALREMDKDTGGWKLATEVGYAGDVSWDDSIICGLAYLFPWILASGLLLPSTYPISSQVIPNIISLMSSLTVKSGLSFLYYSPLHL